MKVEIYCEAVREGLAYFDLRAGEYPEAFRDIRYIILKASKKAREGKWYEAKLEITELEGAKTEDGDFLVNDENKSLILIRGTWGSTLYYFNHEAKSAVECNLGRLDRLTIFDVGHGNAVQLYDSNQTDETACSLWFDFGCEFRWPNSSIATIASELNAKIRVGDLFVLSHWDLDHVICLKHVKVNAGAVLVFGLMPNTRGALAILNNLKSVGVPVYSVPSGTSIKSKMTSLGLAPGVKLWIPAFNKSSSNSQSLVLQATNKEDVFLMGDQNYNRFCNSASIIATKTNMLISHHGGNAGVRPRSLAQFCNNRVWVSCDVKVHSYKSRSINWSEFRPYKTTVNSGHIDESF